MSYSINNCPHCGKVVCNGMGSAEMPVTTMLLQIFPMSRIFLREYNMHDEDFHYQRGFEKSNGLFKSRLKARLRLTEFKGFFFVRFSKRRWYAALIPVIVWFVGGKNGREAYEKGACKKLPIGMAK